MNILEYLESLEDPPTVTEEVAREDCPEFHPAANLFPLMHGDELRELAADIAANGLEFAILLDAKGRIVDGRNRYLACKMAGVAPRYERLKPGKDPWRVSITRNVRRRNLSVEARAIAAARAWDDYKADHGGDRRSKNGKKDQVYQNGTLDPSKSGRTNERLAEVFAVARGSIDQARALLLHDAPGLAAVESGAKTLAVAHEDYRKRVVDALFEAGRLKKIRAEDPTLAEQVEKGAVTLADAEKRLAAAAEEVRKDRYSITCNVFQGTQQLRQPATEEHLRRAAALLDPVVEARLGGRVTVEGLREVAAFAAGLADVLEEGGGRSETADEPEGGGGADPAGGREG